MKTLIATIFGLALVTAASPAAAYVVAVPTSISAKSIADDTDLTAALRSAIDDVLSHAVAFSPTFVTVQTARLVGDRVYILLLIGDADGEETIKTMMSSSHAEDEDVLK
jgi:cytochrome c biogenesis protein CcdA